MRLSTLICSIKNKRAELETFLVTHNILNHFLIGTESHLDQEITNSEIFPEHYYAFRKYRNIHGGGVFILVDKSVSCNKVTTDSSCEIVWVQLHLQNDPNTILGSFYCPPHSPAST